MVVSNKEINDYKKLIQQTRAAGSPVIAVGVDQFKNLVDAAQRVATIEVELKQAIAALNMKSPSVSQMEAGNFNALELPTKEEDELYIPKSKKDDSKKGWSV
jgi:hypothetical protein